MAIGRALGRFETALALTGERAPFVVTVVLRLDGAPPPERVRAALDLVARRHALLSMRIVARGGRRLFEAHGASAVPLCVRARGGGEDWQAAVESELNRAFDAATDPLLRATYLAPAAPGARGDLVLSFHHAVMDAASGATLLREVLAACAGDAPAPAADTLPAPVEAHLPPRFKGFPGAWRRLRFAAAQLADEALYRARTRGARRPPADPARCRILPVALEPAASAALVQATRRRRVTLNAALNAALLLGVCRHLYGGHARPLRYITFADLRPHLRPPLDGRGLASAISMLRYTADVQPEHGFWPLARAVTHQTAAGARRGDKFVAVQLAEPFMRRILRQDKERMAATALSFMGPTRLGPRGGTLALAGMHAFVSNLGLGPEYTAQARLFDGRLLLDAVYLDGDMDHGTARAIARDVLDTLRAAGRDGEST